MQSFIAELRTEHGAIIRALKALTEEIERLRHEQTPDPVEVSRIIHLLTREPDRIHHPKEELMFARVEERVEPAPPILRQLRAEHHSILEQGWELLELLDNRPQDRDRLLEQCRDYVRSQRWHISQEESQIFQLAEEVLEDSDWEDISIAVAERFGDDAHWRSEDWPEASQEVSS